MTIPVLSARGTLQQATLQVVYPPKTPPVIIPLRFNPTEYQLQKSNVFDEQPVPKLETTPIQFNRGSAEKLSVEVLADTSDSLEDVRVRYVQPVRDLMKIEPELHGPPVVAFIWGTENFRGALDSLQVTYTLFSPEGVPLRAKMALSLVEYRPVEQQQKESPPHSPDLDKSYVVRAGDTLAGVAATAYKDPALWREIARRNGLKDPRRLSPGTTLLIPKLR